MTGNDIDIQDLIWFCQRMQVLLDATDAYDRSHTKINREARDEARDAARASDWRVWL